MKVVLYSVEEAVSHNIWSFVSLTVSLIGLAHLAYNALLKIILSVEVRNIT